jgi:hypothetical protein
LTYLYFRILQGRWQHGEEVGNWYPNGLEKTVCQWDIYFTLVMKGLRFAQVEFEMEANKCRTTI